MNELNFVDSAVNCRANSVEFVVEVSVLDVDGNCVQVIPLKCPGICYPYNVKDAIEQIVTQLNGRISDGQVKNSEGSESGQGPGKEG